MNDFASALLLSLVEHAARRVAADGGAPPRDAWASFEAKRHRLADVYARHGATAVLGIGAQVRTYGPHPTIEVLIRARDPADLIARWQRVERFVHSRHRLKVLAQQGTELLIDHVSRDPEPPTAAEDLLILGVIVALAEMIGAHDLTADVVLPSGASAFRFEAGAWTAGAPLDAAPSSRWRLRWSHVEPPTRVGDDTLHAAAELPLVERLIAVVMRDCCRAWRLGELAALCGATTRTLQRRLTEAGTSFSAVVRTAQVRRAGGLLLDGTLPVAHVGLSAGFSDQAHFTREFKRRVGVSPAKYRALFAPPRSP